MVGLELDNFSWQEENMLAGCAYPRTEAALAALQAHGISLLINLAERAHDAESLRRHGLTEVHLPVPDFTAPSQEHLDRGTQAIQQALAAGQRVAVHCAGGYGRTGTLLACRLVQTGVPPAEAIARVRHQRPGSIETADQEAAVAEYARRHQG